MIGAGTNWPSDGSSGGAVEGLKPNAASEGSTEATCVRAGGGLAAGAAGGNIAFCAAGGGVCIAGAGAGGSGAASGAGDGAAA